MPATNAQETLPKLSQETCMKNLTQVHSSQFLAQQLAGQSHCTVCVMCRTYSV